MSFKRNDIQEYIESKCGCTDNTKWPSYKQKLRELHLSANDVESIKSQIKNDAISYWLKAIHSFTQALEGIYSGNSAWSIVKLYYSVFYCIRGELLSNNRLLIRNQSLFHLDLNTEKQFSDFKCGKIRGDHQLTIRYYIKLVNDGVITDLVSSNQIDGDTPYEWMLKQRERVNYHMQRFPDPRIDELLDKTHEAIKHNSIDTVFKQIDSSFSSDGIYLFDKEYSMIAIPFYKLQILLKHMQNFQLDIPAITIELGKSVNILSNLNISTEVINKIILK